MTPSTDTPADPPDNDELAAQLDELEATLTDLRGELRTDDRQGPPQPPQLGELLRFTEQYTIPTLIAILEAAIRSLELLRRTLRLADPARAAREEGEAARDRANEVGGEAGRQLADALTELRTALGEADLPENAASRDLITDARELTGEIESRLRDAEATVDDHRNDGQRGTTTRSATDDSTTDDTGGVLIDVSDEEGSEADIANGSQRDENSQQPDGKGGPEVNVDAELESIKAELDNAERADAEAADDLASDNNETAGRGDSEDADDTSTEDADDNDN